MRKEIGWRLLAAMALLAGTAVRAQDSAVVLTGVARDFQELVEKQTTGGHPDFNPNTDEKGNEIWGCMDRPDAAKGAVQAAPATADANPDLLPGLIPFDRDEVGPALKPAYAAPPNCYRSRFAEWYTTRTPDINRAFFVDLPFVKEGSVYKYDNAEFFPLDNAKLPNLRPQVPTVTTTFGHRQSGLKDGIDLASHNFGFTFEFHARFTYRKGTGQRFDFRGDDDVWVFIDGRLVIDLGGLHSAEYAAVDLDTMDLADGKPYFLDFFFAERRITSSRLTITTSLELKNSDKPDPPVPPTPVRATEGWLYDRDGDGIADSAEVAFDSVPDKTPTAFELYLAGEAERGNWDIAMGAARDVIRSRGQFFTRPVTGWDENDPANRGKALPESATGLVAGDFPLHDRIGPVIDKAWKILLDTSLAQVPKLQIQVRFSEPVAVGAPAVLKFRNPAGVETPVDLIEAVPDSAVGGRSISWSFTIAPASPNVPGEKWTVAISGLAQVRDAAGNPAHPANPWKPVEAKLPTVVIGHLQAEKGGTAGPGPDPAVVHDPFVLLTSDKITALYKDYVPLHPETSEDWIRRYVSGAANPGLVVFGFKLSHPADVELIVFDNLGQFVNTTKIRVTREDLQSGKLARDPVTRAYLLRLGWFPVSRDGNRISTGAYILKAVFKYGLDARDYVQPGSQVKVSRFGFIRDAGLRGLGQP
jgi:fibro-slime domain-containing protein